MSTLLTRCTTITGFTTTTGFLLQTQEEPQRGVDAPDALHHNNQIYDNNRISAPDPGGAPARCRRS